MVSGLLDRLGQVLPVQKESSLVLVIVLLAVPWVLVIHGVVVAFRVVLPDCVVYHPCELLTASRVTPSLARLAALSLGLVLRRNFELHGLVPARL